MSNYFKYWGKADKDGNYHLLVYHCLDVAAVGAVWLEKSPAFVKRGAVASGLSEKAFTQWTIFFLALHDIGKYDVRFQGKVPNILKILQPTTAFSPQICHKFNHGSAGYQLGTIEENSYFNTESSSFTSWLQKVTGHHGRIPQGGQLKNPPLCVVNREIIEDDKNSRINFVQTMKELLVPEGKIIDIPENPPSLLAGFCSVCDWLGSNSDFFPLVDKPISESKNNAENLRSYFNLRLKNATEVLESAGVLSILIEDAGMENLYPDFQPQGVQTVINELPLEQSLTIIEAPTGSGKTEAALAYASLLTANGIADTITFALPTQATTNAMLSRMEEVAPKFFKGNSNLVLAHGKSGFNKSFTKIKRRNKKLPKLEDCQVQCSNWIGNSKKRSFLGQIGLCTIDQVLLSVLPVKHYFVRAFGIGRSVLIVDEVHAYDSYMYGLLEEVIREQKKLGGSVILLSATLPFIQKKRLLNAWEVEAEEQSNYSRIPYPLLTSTSLSNPITLADKNNPISFSVDIETINGDKLSFNDELISRIICAAENGAVVGVICNIVADAQKLADIISTKVSDTVIVDIFHSRYRFLDRQVKESAVIEQYGQKAERTGRILVATQVVEQSLDIDFDWIITQLCPVDLLFQRLGRLHRHNHKRPEEFANRRVTVILPENNLEYGGTGFVYSNILALWRTQKLLEENKQIKFPLAYRKWIEKVYDIEEVNGGNKKLQELNKKYIEDTESRRLVARYLTNNRDTINSLDDLSEKANSLTRDGEMSISLIPVLNDGSSIKFLDGIDISAFEEWEKWEAFSMNSVPVPSYWKNELQLFEKGYMKIEMNKVTDDTWRTDIGKYNFCYSKERGLERIKI